MGLPPSELWGVATRDATHEWAYKRGRRVLVPKRRAPPAVP